MARALYELISHNDHYVVIDDLDGAVSVTNDAEAVVKELLEKFPGRRLYYYDTMGHRDELCHDGTKFTHFLPARGVLPRD